MGRGDDARQMLCRFSDRTRVDQKHAGRSSYACRMGRVGTLAAGIAHDFRNLLSAIVAQVELVRQDLPDAHRARRQLRLIEEAVRQGNDLTESLLGFVCRGRALRSSVNFSRLVSESAGLIRATTGDAEDVVVEVASEPDIWIRGDATQLRRVLMNLADNARRAMRRGSRLVMTLRRHVVETAEATAGEGENRAVARLIVADTGVGMSDEVRSRLFDPLSSTKPGGGTAGLGMWLVHDIVTDHGGWIHAESQPGRGTRVSVTFPTCPPPRSGSDRGGACAPTRGRGEHILVVAGDDYIRSIVTSTLRAQGYEPVPATDGAEATELLNVRRATARLAVLDLDGSGTDDQLCLREMRRVRHELPVIVITGSAGLEPAGMLTEREFLLRKPFRTTELEALVGRVLARTEPERAERC